MPKKFDPALLPASPDFCFEAALWESGAALVAGLDEAGRGALAGPVAAGAVIFPPDAELAARLFGVRDSKQMPPQERDAWAGRLTGLALAWGVGFASNQEIDLFGILPATRLAMQRALERLGVCPQHLLVDFLRLPDCPIPQTPLVKGDARSLSIAAASILAKSHRDALMRRLALEIQGYGLAKNKGYGTAAHRAAIHRFGFSSIHRRTFQLHDPVESER